MDSSLDAERALLGAMLTDPEGRQHVLGFVQPDDFYRPPPMASHAPAYAGIVIGASLRRRLTVCGGRLRQVGQISGREVVEDLALENARLLVSGERLAAGACHRRWASLPPAMREQLPVPARADGTYAEIARRAGLVRDELARLREDVWAAGSSRAAARLADIARGIAENAAALASQHGGGPG